MAPADEIRNASIDELQWAHATLLRLVETVRRHALVGDQTLVMGQEAVVTLSKGLVVLESVIQEHLTHAKRRREDSREARGAAQ